MKPRERFLTAVNHQEVFPIPTDVMENTLYPGLEAGLCQHFGLAGTDLEGLLKALNAHARWGKPAYIGPPLEEAPFQPPNPFPAKKATRSIWGSWSGMNTYTDEIERPLANAESIADIEAHSWPDPDWFDYGRIGWHFQDSPDDYLPVADWAAQHGDYVRIVGGFEPVFSRIMDLCGMQVGLTHMATRPDLVEAMTAHIGDFLEEYYRRIARAGQGYIDILAFGDDFAGQQGMLLSPGSWREFFLPLWRRLFAVAHQYEMKAMMHMCGAVRPVLADLIDVGLDIYEVVQVTTAGMDAAGLKHNFGRHLVFYGGVDTQSLLPNGSPEDVRDQVRRLIEILGEGGGYVLASQHLLMDDVPVENVLAMYDEAYTYRVGKAVASNLRQ
jgi:uroporphyrinogen decarboxylase